MIWLKATTPLLAILALTVLEWRALNEGLDWTLFGIVATLIAGLGGFQLRRVWEDRNDKSTERQRPGRNQRETQ